MYMTPPSPRTVYTDQGQMPLALDGFIEEEEGEGEGEDEDEGGEVKGEVKVEE